MPEDRVAEKQSLPQAELRLPRHPPWTHFPMAFLGATSLWDVLTFCDFRGLGSLWPTLAFWNLVLGLGASLPAMATGVLDYLRLPADGELLKVAGRHMLWIGGALVCYLSSLLWRMGQPAPGQTNGLGIWALAAAGVGLALLLLGGHRGGELAYRSAKRAGKREKSV